MKVFKLLALAVALLSGCASNTAPKEHESPKLSYETVEEKPFNIAQLSSQSLAVYVQLHRIPNWASGEWWERNKDYTVDGTVVVDVANKLKTLPLDDFKAAVKEISEKTHYNLDETGRIYLVLRAYFKVGDIDHDKLMQNEKRYFGSWMRPINHDRDAPYNAAWPLAWKADGTLRIHHSMGYCGPPYDPVKEMEFFVSLAQEK